ncbi:MAG: PAS domain S-box protein, partial [Methanobacterium sp.]|nr:PAS domain S-box protein [Methanobacterium sp.]
MKSRILIVEDGMIEATNFEQLLKSSGYDVVGIASTGEDAITKADILKPDLVLMDIILKGDIDGIDAAEQIKDYLDIPVVYLSTHSEKSTVKRAKLTYPYGYIIKPVNIAELSNTIELALSKHQMEKKLKESEERYRNIVETTNEGVAIESDFKIVFINQRMCDLLGYTEEELLDHNIFELVIDTYEFDFENDYNKLKKGKKFNFTSKLRRKDGYFIFTLTKLSPLYDDQGNYYGNLTMHSDITKQVNAEEALKASEEKYRTLFESLSLGVVYQDQDGFIISANPAAEEILGLTLDQMQGRSSTDPLWRSVHEDMSDFPGE